MAVKTFTTGEVLTAADTNTFLTNAGHNYITGAAFSGITNAAPLNVDNVFTATYRDYLLVIDNCNGTATFDLLFQWRVGGVTTTAGYFTAYVGLTSAAGAFNASNNGGAVGAICMSGDTAAGSGSSTSQIMTPNTTGQAAIQSVMFAQGPGYYQTRSGGGALNAATDFTGFTLRPSTGTVAGNYALYGYRKA